MFYSSEQDHFVCLELSAGAFGPPHLALINTTDVTFDLTSDCLAVWSTKLPLCPPPPLRTHVGAHPRGAQSRVGSPGARGIYEAPQAVALINRCLGPEAAPRGGHAARWELMRRAPGLWRVAPRSLAFTVAKDACH